MNRSTITKKKTKKTSAFDREFEAMKPIIRARSRGKCEAERIAVLYATTHEGEGVASALLGFLSWHQVNCDGRATDTHHRKYRGKSRGGTNAESNLADLSLACHSWAHAHGGFGQPANLIGLALSAGQSEDL